MKPSDLRKLNTRVAYPWPIERPNIPDITGMELDEILYGPGPNRDGTIGSFVLGYHELAPDGTEESSFIIGGSSIGSDTV